MKFVLSSLIFAITFIAQAEGKVSNGASRKAMSKPEKSMAEVKVSNRVRWHLQAKFGSFSGPLKKQTVIWQRKRMISGSEITTATLSNFKTTWSDKVKLDGAALAEKIMRDTVEIYNLPKGGLFKSDTVPNLFLYEGFWAAENAYIKIYVYQKNHEVNFNIATTTLYDSLESHEEIEAIQQAMLKFKKSPQKSASFLNWLIPTAEAAGPDPTAAITGTTGVLGGKIDNLGPRLDAAGNKIGEVSTSLNGVGDKIDRVSNLVNGQGTRLNDSIARFSDDAHTLVKRTSRTELAKTMAVVTIASVATEFATSGLIHGAAAAAGYFAKSFYYWFTGKMTPEQKERYKNQMAVLNDYSKFTNQIDDLERRVTTREIALELATNNNLNPENVDTIIEENQKALVKIEKASNSPEFLADDSCRDLRNKAMENIRKFSDVKKWMEENSLNGTLISQQWSICDQLKDEFDSWNKMRVDLNRYRASIPEALMALNSEFANPTMETTSPIGKAKNYKKACEESLGERLQQAKARYSLASGFDKNIAEREVALAEHAIDTCKESGEQLGIFHKSSHYFSWQAQITSDINQESQEIQEKMKEYTCTGAGCEANHLDKMQEGFEKKFAGVSDKCDKYVGQNSYKSNAELALLSHADTSSSNIAAGLSFGGGSSTTSAVSSPASSSVSTSSSGGWFSGITRAVSGFFSGIASFVTAPFRFGFSLFS